MHFTASIAAFALSMAIIVSAAPTTSFNVEFLFPLGKFTPMLDARDLNIATQCPSANKCGVVTFKSGQFTSFGQGTCMQLGSNVQTIYVANCFCSLWNSCTGNSSKDVYIDGMMMCQKPKTMEEFGGDVKYISCGGMN